MTANGHDEQPNERFKLRPWWVVLVLMMIVLLMSFLALNSPISQRAVEMTPSVMESEDIGLGTGTPDTATGYPLDSGLEQPVTEEIGTTDGIILWSTFLILILLVATLRELLHRRTN